MAAVASTRGDSLRKDSVHAQEGYQWQKDSMLAMQEKSEVEQPVCPTPRPTQRTRRVKRKDDGLWDTVRRGIVDHQLGLSINAILLLTLSHLFFPRLRPSTIEFFTLSNYDAATGLYNPGANDLKFVAFCVVVFTGLRAGMLDLVYTPLARRCGMTKKKTCVRFAEQAWLLTYYIVLIPTGLYIYATSPYFLNLPAMWENFPQRSMTGLHKWYYLVQFAFWLQQIVVVNIEERRKDHWQMFTHHIITSALVFGSYGNYQVRVGTVILFIMDVVDLFLPAAKIFRYLGLQTLCDITFGIFLVTWFAARHVCYMAICYSLYTHINGEPMPYSCNYPATGTQTLLNDGGKDVLSNMIHAYTDGTGPVCFNQRMKVWFLTLLLALQVITIAWFVMICRVAYSVICGRGADDSRSDDEGEDEEEEIEQMEQIHDFSEKEPEVQTAKVQAPPKEEEVGVDELRFVRRSSSPKQKKASKRSKGMSSGISIPGHGDKKELLGRIGCDKPGS